MRCQFKKGILRPRSCTNPSDQSCKSCETLVCTEHSATHNGEVLCLNCFSKENNINNRDGYYYDEYNGHQSIWYYSMYSSFHNEYGVEAFDETDYSGFEAVEESYNDVEQEQDDFLDS